MLCLDNAHVQALDEENYEVDRWEGNEIADALKEQAEAKFREHNHEVLIHTGNWFDIPDVKPPYTQAVDFALLCGNSMAYVGMGSAAASLAAMQDVLLRFNRCIKKGGHLFIDHRNFDFMFSLAHEPIDKRKELFVFDKNVYYQGTGMVDAAAVDDKSDSLHPQRHSRDAASSHHATVFAAI